MGTIRYLGKGRNRPYAVHPPCTECDPITGEYIRPKALCYVDSWYTGFSVLAAYHAGTYQPGDEYKYMSPPDTNNLDNFCQTLAGNFRRITTRDKGGKTFAEVYQAYFDSKFGEKAPKKLSDSSKASSRAAFRLLSQLHDRPITDLTVDEMQAVLNDCPKASASLENMVMCIKQVFNYAEGRGYIDKNIGRHVVVPSAKEDEHGVPFTIDDIHRLWDLADDPTAEFILIMIYSGFRITAYESMEINLEEGFFQGGVKTKSSKNRIVPIHPYILPLVKRRIAAQGKCINSAVTFRADMKAFLREHGFEAHTPHDCRHTFSMLCEKCGVNESDRKRMMGHSFGGDITNGIYGHRSLDDLKAEIQKINIR